MIDPWASIIWLKQSPTMSRTSKWCSKPCITLGFGFLLFAMVIWNVILSMMALFLGRQKPAVIGTISFTRVPCLGFEKFNAAFTKIPSRLWTAFIRGFSYAGGSPITQQGRKDMSRLCKDDRRNHWCCSQSAIVQSQLSKPPVKIVLWDSPKTLARSRKLLASSNARLGHVGISGKRQSVAQSPFSLTPWTQSPFSSDESRYSRT